MTSVFISYSSRDVKIAETIQKWLEDKGFRTWRDERSIEADWSSEIANALTECDIILLLWTNNGAKSEWVKNEWITARALGKIIKPVLFADSPPLPKPLVNLKGVTLAKKTARSVIHLSELGVLDRAFKRNGDFHIDYDYKIVPDNFQIGFNPNPKFTGRDDDLIDLYLKMIGNLNKIGISHTGLYGMGGIGKTQLAVEFAYRFGYAFEGGVFWIQATNPKSWRGILVELARRIPQIVNSINRKIAFDTDYERDNYYLSKFEEYCRKNGNEILLIIDNVHEPIDLSKGEILFPNDISPIFSLLSLRCCILFTTRRDFQLPGVLEHNVSILSPDSSYSLLLKEASKIVGDSAYIDHVSNIEDTQNTIKRNKRNELQRYDEQEREYANKICKAVGYLPLGIVLIGALLRKKVNVSFKDYYHELRRKGLEVIDLDQLKPGQLATKHATALKITMDDQLQMLEEYSTNSDHKTQTLHKNAKILFQLLGFFGESTIVPKARLLLFTGINNHIAPSKPELFSPSEDVFELLDELNLLDILDKGESVRLHPILRMYSQSITNRISRSFKSSAIRHFKSSYDNFSRLVQEYKRRGIRALIEDFDSALEFCDASSGTEISNEFKAMQMILRKEQNNIESFTSESSFAQQVHVRAFHMKFIELARKADHFLSEQKKPYLSMIWNVSDKADFLRTISVRGLKRTMLIPDGTKVVAGSDDGTVSIWDLVNGKKINSWKTDLTAINSLAITPDGTKIVVESKDMISVWELSTGKNLKNWKARGSKTNSLAVTPDNTKVITRSRSDNVVRIWDLVNGKKINSWKTDRSETNSLAITPDGTKIVLASKNMISVWELSKGRQVNTLKAVAGWPINSLAVTPDGAKVVAGSVGGILYVGDLVRSKRLKNSNAYGDTITSLTVTPDGAKVVAGSNKGMISVWDPSTAVMLERWKAHVSTIHFLSVRPDGNQVVAGSDDGTIRVWDLSIEQKLTISNTDSFVAYSMAITPDGTKVIRGLNDGTIDIWDSKSGQKLKTWKTGITITSLVATPDGTRIAIRSRDEAISIWDVNRGKKLKVWKAFNPIFILVLADPYLSYSLVVTPDGKMVIAGDNYDNKIRIWDLRTGKNLKNYNARGLETRSLTVTPDSKKIVVGSLNGNINILNIRTGHITKRLKASDFVIGSLAVTPDGKKIVARSEFYHGITAFDLDTGKRLKTWNPRISIASLAVTADGKYIVAGSKDNSCRILDLSMIEICGVKFDYPVCSVATTNNGKNILLLDLFGGLHMLSAVYF